jgi:hypothetical protein
LADPTKTIPSTPMAGQSTTAPPAWNVHFRSPGAAVAVKIVPTPAKRIPIIQDSGEHPPRKPLTIPQPPARFRWPSFPHASILFI